SRRHRCAHFRRPASHWSRDGCQSSRGRRGSSGRCGRGGGSRSLLCRRRLLCAHGAVYFHKDKSLVACQLREIVWVIVPKFLCLRPDEPLRRGPGLDRQTRSRREGPELLERKRLAAGWVALKVPSSHVYGCCPFVFDR